MTIPFSVILQDTIVQLNEENHGLHDALGILRSEIEQLQAENVLLKQRIARLEGRLIYPW